MTNILARTAVVLLCVILSLLRTGHAQENKPRSIPVQQALQTVTKLYGTRFLYEAEVLAGKTTTTDPEKVKDKPLEEVLKGILYPNNLVFLYVEKNHYTIVARRQPVGKEDGNIAQPRRDTLPAVTRSNMQLPGDTLISSNKTLGEVVVVGYGRQKKLNLTGSVETISGDRIANRPVQDMSNLLTGQVPGVTVEQTSGQPGRDGGSIRIRGIGTLGNNDPLVIVDGVEAGYSNVDPNDIASISVLKDASAAAIYGVRAANGVLLITTKRGKAGRMSLTYNNYFGVQQATRLPRFANSADYAMLYNEALANDGSTPQYTAEDIQKYRDGSDPDFHPNSDWVGSLFSRSGFLHNHYLAMTGGTERTRYNISLGYLNRTGLVANTASDRYTLRINFDQDFSDRFKVGLNISASRQEITEPSMSMGELVHRAYRESPTATIRYSNGNWGGFPYDHNSTAIAESGGIQKSASNIFTGTLNAEYEILKGLKLRGIASVTDNTYKGHTVNQALKLYNVDVVTTTYRSSVSDARYESLEVNLQAFLDYTHSFNEVHNIKALLGYNQISDTYDEIGAGIYDLPSSAVDQLNAGNKATWSNYGNATDYRLRSYFGRVNYNFKEKYLLEANFRYDGTSRFPKKNRYGFFPSFSAGWNISREIFFPVTNWLDNLKLRGSWGRLGNQEIGNYRYKPTYALGINYTFGGALTPGIAENSDLTNPDISWESTTETNLAFDADLFNGKLSVTAEYYIRKTADILLNLPQPSILGGNPPYVNAASVSNKGIDFIVRHQHQIGKVAYWINANMSYVKNRITDLAGADQPGRSIGDPINNIYGYVALGLFRSQDEVDKCPTRLPHSAGPSPEILNMPISAGRMERPMVELTATTAGPWVPPSLSSAMERSLALRIKASIFPCRHRA